MIIKNAKVFMDEIGCFENLDIRVVVFHAAENVKNVFHIIQKSFL